MSLYYKNDNVQLYYGDNIEILPKLIQQNKLIDTIITDPPYVLSMHGGITSGLSQRTSKVRQQIDWISNGFDIKNVLPYLVKICKIPNILMFCSNKQILQLMQWFQNQYLNPTLLVWQKTNPPPTAYGNHMSDLEFVVYSRAKGAFFNNDQSIDIKRKCKIYPIVSAKKRYHPTQKPIILIQQYIRLHSRQNDIILDPFAGSGTTGIACMNTNRNCILIQKQEKYCEIAAKRLQNIVEQKQNDLFKGVLL